MIELYRQIFNIRLLDIIDITLVSFLLYQLYKIIKGTSVVKIFIGIISIFIIWKIVNVYNMFLLEKILSNVINFGVIILIVVFQHEIRQFLLIISDTNLFKRESKLNIFNWQEKYFKFDINPIVKACINMSKNKTGALIVIAKNNDLHLYIKTGEIIDAIISSTLIENIFYKNSPLHDGAIIIVDNRIKATRCVLPLSESPILPANLGLRHRAALGLTEKTDAIVIVISEQTGQISISKEGHFKFNVPEEELHKTLEQEIAKH